MRLKKDVENMEKGEVGFSRNRSRFFNAPPPFCLTQRLCLPVAEELQKVLLEQIDFRRRLEQEFHALKGTSPFPVFRESEGQLLLLVCPPAPIWYLGQLGLIVDFVLIFR